MTSDDMCIWNRTREITYLRLARRVFIIAIGGSTQGSTRAVITSANTAALGQVLLALRLADLDLLLFTTATQLLGLEGALRLELGATMLGNVTFGHGCECRSPLTTSAWVMEGSGAGGDH